MKRIAFILLIPLSAWAGTPQIFFGVNTGGQSNAATSMAAIYGMSGGGFDSAVLDRSTSIIASSGTFSNFGICLNAAPGVGKSWALTVQLGARNQDSPITCTISGTDTCCYDITHSSSVVPGDLARIKSVPSGTPTASGAQSYRIMFTPTEDNNYVVAGGQTSNSASTTYIPLAGTVGARTTSTDTSIPMPHAGTFDRLYAAVPAAPGAGKSYTFTFRTNGSNSSITCAISGASATSCSDLTHSSATIRGDSVNVSLVPGGAPSLAQFHAGLRFVPANRGEFPILGNTFNAMSTSADTFVNLSGGNLSNLSEVQIVSTTTSPSPGLIIKNGTYSVTTAPGGATSYTNTLRRNFANPTGGPTGTISGANTTAQDNGFIVVSELDNLVNKWTPSGTPTAGMAHISYTGYLIQPLMTPVFP